MTASDKTASDKTVSDNWMLVAAGVLLIPLGLWFGGVFDDESNLIPEATPTDSDTDDFAQPAEPVETESGSSEQAVPDEGTPEPSLPTRSDPDQQLPADAPRAVALSLAAAEAGELTDVGAILRNDRLHLIGTVADRASADRARDLAASLVGDAAVLDFLVIDERATALTDPVLRVDASIRFGEGGNVIDSRSLELVDGLGAFLAEGTEVAVEVVGHTDDSGDDIANLDLSLRRAQAVVDRLVAAGVDRGRLTASGRGETRPVADNATEQGRERNRRIELIVSSAQI